MQNRHKGSTQGNQQQGKCLDAVTLKAVIGLPTELGADHIPQRVGNEDGADLVKTAVCVLSQPGQGWSAKGHGRAECDEGSVIGESRGQRFEMGGSEIIQQCSPMNTARRGP